MVKSVRVAIAAASLLLATGVPVVLAAQNSDGAVPSRYVQMNSPGDGISSGAARTGNGRARRPLRRHHRYHHHHRHHR